MHYPVTDLAGENRSATNHPTAPRPDSYRDGASSSKASREPQHTHPTFRLLTPIFI